MPIRFLLDEDVHPGTAPAGRALDLDVVSVHEIGRTGSGFPDQAHLAWAAAEDRVMVTRNRDDFIRLTPELFRTGAPHRGLLIIPHTLPNAYPGRIARALLRWTRRLPDDRMGDYAIDFLDEPVHG